MIETLTKLGIFVLFVFMWIMGLSVAGLFIYEGISFWSTKPITSFAELGFGVLILLVLLVATFTIIYLARGKKK